MSTKVQKLYQRTRNHFLKKSKNVLLVFDFQKDKSSESDRQFSKK
ncbi:hypothetical protein HMPREF9071_0665 [Capnocytophaga sp. oral taxon 338 str. F0234]|nr:hypothetical protein HMPREF9071_0665 [Capnocytophaga sp. oral taxon 338 str. F0234]